MTVEGTAASGVMEPEGGGVGEESAVGSRQSAEEGATPGGETVAEVAASADDAGDGESVPAGGLDEGQLARLREVLVAAHPDAVPELIAGADFDALLGSVAGAQAAFARVREEASRFAADPAARAAAGSVPRGGGTREIDPAVFAGLSPEGKIAQGLRGR